MTKVMDMPALALNIGYPENSITSNRFRALLTVGWLCERPAFQLVK